MSKLEEIHNKPYEKRTPLEQCIVEAELLEDQRDGDYELMEKAAEELAVYIEQNRIIRTLNESGFQIVDLVEELRRKDAALQFYANHNHWMSNTENSDSNLLIAHGKHFDGTSNGWVEADSALKDSPS